MTYANFVTLGADPNFVTDASALLNELLGDGEASGDGANALPIGSTLVIPQGHYRLTSAVIQKRFVNIAIEGNATLQGIFTDQDKDVFTVDIHPGLAGFSDVPRNMRLEGGRIVNFVGGRHGLRITQSAGNLALFQYYVQHVVVSGSETGVLQNAAIMMDGYVGRGQNGPTFCHIEGCTLNGGIHLNGVADGNRIINNSIFGANALGVRLEIVDGAACTQVIGNAITSGQGALEIVKGSEITFSRNQCEQGAGAKNIMNILGDASAQVILRGSNRNYIKAVSIKENNFGAGLGLVDFSIIADYAEDCFINENRFFPGSLYRDARFTANARFNTWGAENRLRHPRNGNGYDARPDKKTRIQDLGNGNSGVSRSITNEGMGKNGYVFPNGYVCRNKMGLVLFEGMLNIPDETTDGGLDGDIVMSLPEGFRHYQTNTAASDRCYISATFHSGYSGKIYGCTLSVDSVGDVRIESLPSLTDISSNPAANYKGTISLSSLSFQAQARDVYNGAD